MKSLELKALKMNDNFPLIISLNGKVEWELDDNKDIVDSHLVNRDDARCTFSTISQTMLYPSSSKEKIVTLLEYFFKVCDVGASPQCMWKTDDCDYISLLLPYTRYDQIKFDFVRNKILEQFPELLMPENCLEKLPDYGKTEDYIASIEVAYPATWTVEYLTKAKSGTNTNSDERKD